MDDKKRISSPEGVSKLMEDMWSRHKAGRKQPENNMFLVDLPPLTEEEKEVCKNTSSAALLSRIKLSHLLE